VDGIYGPATANAVLRYKRKRDIVNRSYQTSADNVVGKMTIASLDREIKALEGPFQFTRAAQSRLCLQQGFSPPAIPRAPDVPRHVGVEIVTKAFGPDTKIV
jgi:hypothetical protein